VKILALERELPDATPEGFRRLGRAEAAVAWELYQAGVLRELYFRQDRPGAVLVLECTGLAAAEETLSTLPIVQAGLIAFDLIPLAPYPGFARLFGEAQPTAPFNCNIDD